MNYISMFSGIEAASVAFEPLGWKPICFAEVDKFPSAVLRHHYPDVPNVGDMTAHDWSQYRGRCDLVVGGPPCQAFSVAGLRQSLDDDRGNLSLQYMKAIHAIDPLWCITENVPGWLSTKDNAFGCFLAGLVGEDAELLPPGGRWTDAGVAAGPQRTAAWVIKDAQYFGVPQRRRRVFVVSVRGTGNWRCAAALFPLIESMSGHSPPRREARQTAPTIPSRRTAGGGLGTDFDCDGGLIAETAPTLVANGNKTGGIRPPGTDGDTVTSLIPVIMSSGQANAEILEDGGAPSLTCLHEAPIVGYVPEVSATLVGRSSRGAGQTNSPGHNADQSLVAMSVDLQNVALGGDVAGTLDTTRPGRGGGQAVMAQAFDLHGSPASEIASETDVYTPLRARMPGVIENSTTTVVATAFKASHFTRGKDGAPSEVAPPLSADADKGDQDTLALVPISFLSNASFPEHGIDIAGTLRTENLHAVAIPVGVEDVADPILANVGKTYTQEGSRNFRLTNVVMAPVHVVNGNSTPEVSEELAFPLRADDGSGNRQAIAFSSKDHGADAGDVSPTLRSMGHDGSHANGGVQVAVAYAFKPGQSEAAGGTFVTEEYSPTLQSSGSGSSTIPAVAFMKNVRGEIRTSDIAPALTSGGGKPGQGYSAVLEPVPFDTTQITSPANYSSPQPGDPSHPLAAGAHPSAVVFESRFARNGRGAPDTIVPPLKAQSGETGKGDAAPLVAFSIMPMNSGKDYKARETDVAQPIMAGGPVGGNQGGDFIKSSMQIRRLTPRECERLQGFRDDYTLVPWRGKLAPDGPRYKALGNSFAVPVVRWIGERIQMVEDLVNGLDKKV